MDIVAWLVIGLVAGVLASVTMRRSRLGLPGDLLLGAGGAFLGGWTFRSLGAATAFASFAGSIAGAFLGAVVTLMVLRLIKSIAPAQLHPHKEAS